MRSGNDASSDQDRGENPQGGEAGSREDKKGSDKGIDAVITLMTTLAARQRPFPIEAYLLTRR